MWICKGSMRLLAAIAIDDPSDHQLIHEWQWGERIENSNEAFCLRPVGSPCRDKKKWCSTDIDELDLILDPSDPFEELFENWTWGWWRPTSNGFGFAVLNEENGKWWAINLRRYSFWVFDAYMTFCLPRDELCDSSNHKRAEDPSDPEWAVGSTWSQRAVPWIRGTTLEQRLSVPADQFASPLDDALAFQECWAGWL